MFSLVAEVEAYPDFIPYCIGLRVLSSRVSEGQGELTADMLVAYKAFREKFRTRVELDKSQGRIEAHYLDGPFRKLHNLWRFKDTQEGSEIDFSIDFEFRSFFLQAAAAAVFERAFVKMSDAFVSRAHEVYGR